MHWYVRFLAYLLLEILYCLPQRYEYQSFLSTRGSLGTYLFKYLQHKLLDLAGHVGCFSFPLID